MDRDSHSVTLLTQPMPDHYERSKPSNKKLRSANAGRTGGRAAQRFSSVWIPAAMGKG